MSVTAGIMAVVAVATTALAAVDQLEPVFNSFVELSRNARAMLEKLRAGERITEEDLDTLAAQMTAAVDMAEAASARAAAEELKVQLASAIAEAKTEIVEGTATEVMDPEAG